MGITYCTTQQIRQPERSLVKLYAAAALAFMTHPALAATPVTGKWITAERDSVIEIGTCGTTVCGKVLRLMKLNPDGKMPMDANNPNPALRTRPVQGIMILTGFTDGGSHWSGRIYDPKSGKSYKSKLTRNADGTLKVQGCIGFLCQSFTWTAAR
jgi:uncharacterized protein (DUF2147 family)